MKQQRQAETEKEAVAGLVERVTFHSPETGFCVLRIKTRGNPDLVPDSCVLRLQTSFIGVSDILICIFPMPLRMLFFFPLHAMNQHTRIELLFKTHNSQRPPQTPAASFKLLYRKCPAMLPNLENLTVGALPIKS